MKTALITGITGQDGAYLARLLLEKDYRVFGVVRRASTPNTERIQELVDGEKIHLRYADLTDESSLIRVLNEALPDEVYNLGAQSHVRISFDIPVYTAQATGMSSLTLLEAIRNSNCLPRFYQASSSEMFGSAPPPQSEKTLFQPRSPYACAKVFAYYTTINYREAYGMHASNGILYNHESPIRGLNFVTRKITLAIANILKGLQSCVSLGNLEAKRDWGHARDYVDAMWRMLQQDKPDDYVIATGEMHSVREFAEEAFSCAGLDWKDFVRIDSRFFRPSEVDALQGDASKAAEKLGWKPKTTFKQLVREMVDADIAGVK
jgi:GDPmannose 4,6-dehydratase